MDIAEIIVIIVTIATELAAPVVVPQRAPLPERTAEQRVAQGPVQQSTPTATKPQPSSLVNRVVRLVQQERSTPLKWSSALARDARRKAASSAASRSRVHDDGPSDWADWARWGENIGSSGGDDPVAYIHHFLMRSSSHRDNILDPGFTHIGVGVAWDEENDVLYVVQHFGEKMR